MTKKLLSEITVGSMLAAHEGSSIGTDFIIYDTFRNVPLPDEPHRMKCLVLGICLAGTARYSLDTIEYRVQPNDIIIISEGKVLDNHQFSPDCQLMTLVLSYGFFYEIVKEVHELSSLFLFARNHPVCPMRPEDVRTIISYLRIIKEKTDEREHHFRKETVRSLIATMIYDISNSIYRIQNLTDSRRSRGEAIFTEYIKLVEQNFRNERRVSWYAQQLCITPKYLSETIRQVSKRTPNAWIDKYVTLEIRVLLKNSIKTIKEITQEMNFPNQSFLGKYFKEHVGMSPTEYRRS